MNSAPRVSAAPPPCGPGPPAPTRARLRPTTSPPTSLCSTGMRRGRTWSRIGALSAASACGPETPEPFWTGTYLAYSSTTEIDVCEGSWVLQDRYVELLSELLGVTPPRPARFAFLDRDEREKFCDDDSLLLAFLRSTDRDNSFETYAAVFEESSRATSPSDSPSCARSHQAASAAASAPERDGRSDMADTIVDRARRGNRSLRPAGLRTDMSPRTGHRSNGRRIK